MLFRAPQLDTVAPVSYTHLDVYKRQEYIKTKGMGGNQWNELRKGRTGLALNYQVRGIPHYVLIGTPHKKHKFRAFQAYPTAVYGLACQSGMICV